MRVRFYCCRCKDECFLEARKRLYAESLEDYHRNVIRPTFRMFHHEPACCLAVYALPGEYGDRPNGNPGGVFEDGQLALGTTVYVPRFCKPESGE